MVYCLGYDCYLRLESSVGIGVRLGQLLRAATQRLPEGETISRGFVVSLPHVLLLLTHEPLYV